MQRIIIQRTYRKWRTCQQLKFSVRFLRAPKALFAPNCPQRAPPALPMTLLKLSLVWSVPAPAVLWACWSLSPSQPCLLVWTHFQGCPWTCPVSTDLPTNHGTVLDSDCSYQTWSCPWLVCGLRSFTQDLWVCLEVDPHSWYWLFSPACPAPLGGPLADKVSGLVSMLSHSRPSSLGTFPSFP